MKISEKWKSIRKRNKVLIVGGIALLVIGTGGFFLFKQFSKNNMENSMPVMNRMENGIVTGSGTTATDMVAKQLEIDSLETALYVEEVYVSSGDSVAAGDKLLKLTEESVEDARKELQQKATEAEVAYNEQKISYEESLIEARKKADITIIEGEYADSSYVLELESETGKVEDLQEQAAEALELAQEYYAAVNSNYYYTYYEVDELQQAANEPFAYLNELYSDWNIEDAENDQSNGFSDAKDGDTSYDPEKYALYQKFDAALTNLMHELEAAKENYESDTNKASYSLEAAQADYELLNAQYEEAVAALEQTKVRLQAECDVAKAEAELAESSYEATEKQLKEELNQVSDEYDTAQDDLQTFEEMVGDGYLYAEEAGSIMMLNAREGNALDVAMPYLVYSDSSNVTVTVSVEQSYIAELSVGDKASVVISGLGTYEGVITSINPVSQSDSRSSIYYSVIVTLSGDVSDVTSNLTATVMFSAGESDIPKAGPTEEQQMNDKNNEGEQGKGEEDRQGGKPQGMESGSMEGMPEKPEKTE